MVETSSLPQNLFKSTKKFPHKLAVSDFKDELSYSQLWKSIEETTNELSLIGIEPHDRVVFSISNIIEFIILHFSIMNIRAISVPLDTQTPSSNANLIIKSSNPKAIIFDDKFKSKLITDEIKADFYNFNDLVKVIKNTPENIDFHYACKSSPDDISSILFTSGSTGAPKGVILTHKNTLTTISNIVDFCGYKDEDFELVTLPLTHSFGLGQVYSMLFVGGSCYLENGLVRMKRVFKALSKYRVTGFPTTPKGVDLILNNYSDLFKEFKNDLKTIIVNSAPLMPDQTKLLQELLPKTKIYVYYGLTEASRSSFGCLTDMGASLYRSVGRPMNSVKITLTSESEILISGPTVSKGYWPNNFFDISNDGFPVIQTGDIGEFDDEGNLFITGRIKDQINIGGFKVDPLEVEKALKEYSKINDVVVSSRLKNNEEEIVYCLLKADEGITSESITNFLRGKIEHYKFPKEIIFLDKFPEGINGKINRKKIKELISKID